MLLFVVHVLSESYKVIAEGGAYRHPGMLQDFVCRESEFGISVQHEGDQILGRAAHLIPVGRSEIERAGQDGIEQLFLIVGRADERRVAAQQDEQDHSSRPNVHFQTVSCFEKDFRSHVRRRSAHCEQHLVHLLRQSEIAQFERAHAVGQIDYL